MKIAYLILIAFSISACSKSNLDYEVLSSQELNCPEGWRAEYGDWGEKGLMYYCQMKNGPVIMAEYGHIAIKGQYKMGKEIGLWQWFDKNGNVTRSEYYAE